MSSLFVGCDTRPLFMVVFSCMPGCTAVSIRPFQVLILWPDRLEPRIWNLIKIIITSFITRRGSSQFKISVETTRKGQRNVKHYMYTIYTINTRMHSSRMRTACSLTISRGICGGNAPLPCMPTPLPPAMHFPLLCMPPLPRTPSVDRILDTRFWKYYLAPTSLWAVKNKIRSTEDSLINKVLFLFKYKLVSLMH